VTRKFFRLEFARGKELQAFGTPDEAMQVAIEKDLQTISRFWLFFTAVLIGTGDVRRYSDIDLRVVVHSDSFAYATRDIDMMRWAVASG
jgi:hypothetical protein